MTTPRDRLWALVLAGGDGTRLQELTLQLTGTPIPKQYCRILGDRSLLEATLARAAPLAPSARTLVIVNQGHLPVARPQLQGLPPDNVLVQPTNRDTGPGLLLSFLELSRRDPDAIVAVFPSDHDVRNEIGFRRCIAGMVAIVTRHPNRLALLGAHPDRIDAGLGYIVPGARLSRSVVTSFRVRAFHEKPTDAVAGRLVRRGGVWNTFVMVGRVARFVELLATVKPDAVRALAPLPDDPETLAAAYGTMAGWNFSRDFLQSIPQHLVVTRGERLGWSDWGTPEAIERTFASLGMTPPWRLAQIA